jgi:hypothetical protein
MPLASVGEFAHKQMSTFSHCREGGERCGRKHLPLFKLTLFKAWPVPRPQTGIHLHVLGVDG